MLLRIGIGDKEALLWLTRRMIKLLWPLMGQIAGQLAPKAVVDPQTRTDISELQREAAMQKMDFSTRYELKREPLWPDGPLLPTELQIKQTAEALPVLCLRNAAGVGIEIPMNSGVHSGFCELLRKSVAESGWDLALDYAKSSAPQERQGLH